MGLESRQQQSAQIKPWVRVAFLLTLTGACCALAGLASSSWVTQASGAKYGLFNTGSLSGVSILAGRVLGVMAVVCLIIGVILGLLALNFEKVFSKYGAPLFKVGGALIGGAVAAILGAAVFLASYQSTFGSTSTSGWSVIIMLIGGLCALAALFIYTWAGLRTRDLYHGARRGSDNDKASASKSARRGRKQEDEMMEMRSTRLASSYDGSEATQLRQGGSFQM